MQVDGLHIKIFENCWDFSLDSRTIFSRFGFVSVLVSAETDIVESHAYSWHISVKNKLSAKVNSANF